MAEKSPQMLRLEQAWNSVEQARNEYDRNVKAAEDSFNRVSKQHAKAVDKAKAALEDEKKRWNSPVAQFKTARLYRDHVAAEDVQMPLSSAVTSTIQTSGETLVLTLTNGSTEVKVNAGSQDENAAQEFSRQVREMGQHTQSNIAEHEKALTELNQNLTAVINSTQDIEQAKKNLEYARAQKGAIQRASLQYEQVRSEVPQEVQKAFDKHNQRMKASSWVVPIALVIVIIISLMLFMLLH